MKFRENDLLLKGKEKIVSVLSETFPNSTNLQENTVTFKNINNKTQISPISQGLTGYVFSTKDGIKTITITNASVVLNYAGTGYINYESFWNEVKDCVEKLFEAFNITQFVWCSIRKINIVNIEITDPHLPKDALASVFNNALVSPHLTIPGNEYLNAGLSNFTLSNGKNNLKITYGLMPNLGKNRELILDIDLINQTEDLSFSQVSETLAEINKEIFDVFHWSLLDTTIANLNKS